MQSGYFFFEIRKFELNFEILKFSKNCKFVYLFWSKVHLVFSLLIFVAKCQYIKLIFNVMIRGYHPLLLINMEKKHTVFLSSLAMSTYLYDCDDDDDICLFRRERVSRGRGRQCRLCLCQTYLKGWQWSNLVSNIVLFFLLFLFWVFV